MDSPDHYFLFRYIRTRLIWISQLLSLNFIIPLPGVEARQCGGSRHFHRTPSAPGFPKEQSKGQGLAPANPHSVVDCPTMLRHCAKSLIR